MFYSQFILAKKGPLGTIWIAAHLERKLRKNQVADTDIGVSVDSILSPDVPIALRLSSHLLLGVVRIYSRKVNYLFDDCSDALLKVKQAFRSTAVDLPPEESKAPYHSITLPETFDLDDFELPDTDVFQGNFVDHHVSTKEQITLQDTLDGAVYSTSQFGLDERFGDGDASEIALDLDEELLLNKGPSRTGVLLTSRVDPEISVEPSFGPKGVELDEEMYDTCQDVGSPSTQPMEMTVSSNIAHIPGMVFEPSRDLNPEFDQNEQSLRNKELEGGLDISHSGECGKAQEIELKDTTVTLKSSDMSASFSDQADHQHDKSTVIGFCSLPEEPSFADQSTIKPAIEVEDKLDSNFNADKNEVQDSIRQEVSEVATDDAKTGMLSVCKPLLRPCTFSNNQENGDLEDLVSLPKDSGVGSDKISEMEDALEVSLAKVPVSSVEAEGMLDINSNTENREGHDLIRPEASEVGTLGAKSDMLSVCKTMFQPSNFSDNQESAELDNLGSVPKDLGIGSEKISGIHDAPEVSIAEVQDSTNRHLNEDQFLKADLCNNLVGKPVTSGENLSPKGGDTVTLELPSPEKMLSVPDVPVNQSNELLLETTPERHLVAQGDRDTTMNKMSGKKRSLTESTITLQSQNSVDTSEAAQSKRSADFVPDDDDLLSSILVGRRSTVLKVRSTPPASDLVSSKRPRVSRSGTNKRKTHVDDSMVLHGDTIRQQLVNTEDIRRVRKKAPSTQYEIWIIQRQLLEEEMFSQPIFTGLSSKLVSLHCRPYDLSETKLVPDDGSKAQSTENCAILSPTGLKVSDDSEVVCVASVSRDENCPQSAVCAFDTPIEQNMRVFSNLYGNDPGNEIMTKDEAGQTTSQTDISENRTEMGTECRSEAIGNETLTNSEAGHTETECRIVSSDLSGNALEHETMNNSVLGNSPLRFEISENITEMDAEYRRESIDDEKNYSVASGIETSFFPPFASEKNPDIVTDDMIQFSCYKDINDADLGEQGEPSCLKLDEQSKGNETLLDVGTPIERIDLKGVKEAFGEATEHRQATFLDIRQEDAESVEPVANAQPESSLPVSDENIFGEDGRSDEGMHELETINKDGFHESDLKYDEQRDNSRLDPSDPAGDVFDHDTDFLNFDDDDEIAEEDENSIPNAGPQVLDNTGWSTRTRAVANYLQVLFHKEAQHGRTVLRLDNLLANKTRKEASRMFFETLVLKTRDYIHVDEEVPFGNINIKPRARLLKSEF